MHHHGTLALSAAMINESKRRISSLSTPTPFVNALPRSELEHTNSQIYLYDGQAFV